MHRLLKRQLKKAFGPGALPPEGLDALLEMVDRAYLQFDEDREMLDRSMELSSRELMQRNAETRAVFQAFPDTFIWVNDEGTVLDCKGGSKDFVNIVPYAVRGTPLHELPIADTSASCIRSITAALATKDIIHTEYGALVGSTEQYYEARYLPLVRGTVLVTIRNITSRTTVERALRTAEAKYRAIFENAVEGIYVSDPSGSIVSVNPAMAAIFGYDSYEDMLDAGASAKSLFADSEDRTRFLDILGELGSITSFEYRGRRKDGSEIWLLENARATFDETGAISFIEGTVQDVTARKRNEILTVILYRIANAVNTTRDLQELYRSIHSILSDFIGAKNFYVGMVDWDTDSIAFPYFVDEADAHISVAHLSDAALRTPTLEVIRTGKPVLAHPVQGTPAGVVFIGTLSEVWLGVPLTVNGVTLGVMVIQDYHDPNRYNHEHLDLLVAVAEQVAMAIGRKIDEQALQESEDKYRSIFENAAWGIYQTAIDGSLISANPAVAHMFGFSSVSELIASDFNVRDYYASDTGRHSFIETIMSKGAVQGFPLDLQDKDGRPFHAEVSARLEYAADGSIQHIDGVIEDVSEVRRAQRALDRQKALFQQLFKNSPQAIALMDQSGRLIEVNESYLVLFDYTSEQLGDDVQRIVPPTLHGESEAFKTSILGGRALREETIRIRRDGSEVPVSIIGYPFVFEDTPAGAFLVYDDISDRKEYERQLTHQAMHDALTGLPNRALFMERMERAIERNGRRPDYSFAVLLIDLDHFKRVNDTLGHLAGDKLLVEAGERIKICLRSMDTIARLGGDEFAVLLEELHSPQEAIAITKRITGSLRLPVRLEGGEHHPSASIGIVLKTERYDNSEAILRDADIAMYWAKERGRDRFKVFDTSMHERAMHAMRMEAEIRQGLERGEFFAVFQPIVRLEDEQLIGFEALARWRHPERGLIGPNEFIPIAEETGLIHDLGAWMLEQSCLNLARCRERFAGAEACYLSVNVSGRQFSGKGMVENVNCVLENTGIPPDALSLEITETSFVESMDVALTKLSRLKKLGVRISVDDFGTGYSSLAHLQRFPADILKIDRSFVERMTHDQESLEIVRAVVALGKSLSRNVIAEGVETAEQLRLLKDIGCPAAQGFYFSKPLETEDASELVRKSIEA